ncbi:MAG: hypothetical protein KGZ69_10885, partial [Methylomonas sp.]|nr:hypothetical protein [Methylomonas sp.]
GGGGVDMSWLMDVISAAFDALVGWLTLIFTSLKNAIFDFPVLIFEKIVQAITFVVNQFLGSVEYCFLAFGGAGALQGRFDALISLPDGIGQTFCFLLANTGVANALSCISAAVAFRLTRKIITLGHW